MNGRFLAPFGLLLCGVSLWASDLELPKARVIVGPGPNVYSPASNADQIEPLNRSYDSRQISFDAFNEAMTSAEHPVSFIGRGSSRPNAALTPQAPPQYPCPPGLKFYAGFDTLIPPFAVFGGNLLTYPGVCANSVRDDTDKATVMTLAYTNADGSPHLFSGAPWTANVPPWGQVFQRVTYDNGNQVIYQNNFYASESDLLAAYNDPVLKGATITYHGPAPNPADGYQLQFVLSGLVDKGWVGCRHYFEIDSAPHLSCPKPASFSGSFPIDTAVSPNQWKFFIQAGTTVYISGACQGPAYNLYTLFAEPFEYNKGTCYLLK